LIPVEETFISMRKIFRTGRGFRALATGMLRVTNAIETTTALRGLVKHTIAAGIWQAIGNAMQHDMDINAGTKRLAQAFATSAVHYVFNQEIGGFGVLAVKECCGNPNLISDFDLG
jgi:hypothetical protein